jgi:hypothetical protein
MGSRSVAREVLSSMLIHNPRLTVSTLLLLGAVATAAGLSTPSRGMEDEPKGSPAGPQPQQASPAPAPGRMFVTGRLVDPQGKPVPGAAVMVHARSLAPGRAPSLSRLSQVPIGEARADGSGRFRLDVPRTSSARHADLGAVALAPGYGAGWVELDPDDEQPHADITLRPEHVIPGRLFDLQGRPAPNVTLSVGAMGQVRTRDPATGRPRYEGVAYGWTKPNDFPAWPRPVTTDPESRFTLRGVGPDPRILLTVHHPKFALERIAVDTSGMSKSKPKAAALLPPPFPESMQVAQKVSESKPMTAALVPAQILTGHVTYADTGKPVPHAPLEVMASQGRIGILS